MLRDRIEFSLSSSTLTFNGNVPRRGRILKALKTTSKALNYLSNVVYMIYLIHSVIHA